MATRIFQVDAFTTEPFRGNPAGVCLPAGATSEEWLQGIAADMNVSETAFLWKKEHHFAIRYFTPLAEVSLCGHATLSSAHILWQEGIVGTGEAIRFIAKGGDLSARHEGDWICLDFPTLPVRPAETPPGLQAVLGAAPLRVSRLEGQGLLVEFDSEEIVRELQPDFAGIRREGFGMIIVTARAKGGPYDFVSRFFAPDIGIDEDPVTGVAHCSLSPYWSERLGKADLLGHQVSRRGGIVRVRSRGARTEILGRALTVLRGEIVI